MKNKQAVKMGDNYVVHLDNGRYKVGDTELTCGYSGSQIVIPVDDLYEIQKILPATKVGIGYTLKDGTECSIEEFNRGSSELHSYFDDDYEDYNFESLEQEYEVKKRAEKYQGATCIYQDNPVAYEDVTDIEVVGEQCDTGSDFISSAFDVGMLNFSRDSGAFKVESLSVVLNEVVNISKKNDWALDVPSHSGIEYVKLSGNYLFTNNSQYKNMRPKIFKELSKAQSYEKELRENTRKLVLTKCSKDLISGKELGHVYKELCNLKTRVGKLDIKQRDESSKKGVLASMEKLIKGLEIDV